jgi:hypothetical protein
MANIVIDIAAEFVGNKAFKQADTATDRLTKNVKTLAKTFGVAFSTTAILAYGKASVKAAAADQKAQQQLALALKNVGLERTATSAETYIQRLQSEFGIVDDLLRPAYQSLAVATRDSAESQRLLNLALDISASTGKDLGSVTTALGRAFLGNNTAITRLGVGISKADLKTKSFKEITDDLSQTFKGSAKAASDTFAGSIAKLGVASANVQEIIGFGLIDSLKTLGGNTTIDDLADDMERAATNLADFLRGLSQIGTFEINNKTKSFFELLLTPFQRSFSAGPLGAITRIGATSRRASEVGAQKNPIQSGSYLTNQTKITKLTIAQTKAAQDQLKLAKAKSIFDLQKIQIEAALKGRISEEDRIRLKLMQAIESENISQIEKYTKLLDDAQKNTEKLVSTLAGIKPLDDIFKNFNFMSVKQQLDTLEGYFKSFVGSAASAFNALGASQRAALGGFVPFAGATNASLGITSTGGATTSMPSTVGLGTSGTGNQLPAGVTINTNVNTGIGDPETIARAVEDVIRQAVGRGTSSLLLPT